MSFHCLTEETEKRLGPKVNSNFVAKLVFLLLLFVCFLKYLTTKQMSGCRNTGPLWSCMNSKPVNDDHVCSTMKGNTL